MIEGIERGQGVARKLAMPCRWLMDSGYFNSNPASPTYEADARDLQTWLETQASYANSTNSIDGVTSDYATVATAKALADTLYAAAAAPPVSWLSLVLTGHL